MSGFKPDNFSDRLEKSKAARVAAVEKFQAVTQVPEDPVKIAGRQTALAAREAKRAERNVARRAKLAEAETAKRAKAAAHLAKQRDVLRSAEEEAARKALRDARYAARKARR